MSDAPATPLIQYPTLYSFKVMGRPEGFQAHVLALLERTLSVPVDPAQVVTATSSQGSYVSLTIPVRLEDEASRQAVYQALHADPLVLYFL
jgi:uncharacterized protein